MEEVQRSSNGCRFVDGSMEEDPPPTRGGRRSRIGPEVIQAFHSTRYTRKGSLMSIDFAESGCCHGIAIIVVYVVQIS